MISPLLQAAGITDIGEGGIMVILNSGIVLPLGKRNEKVWGAYLGAEQ